MPQWDVWIKGNWMSAFKEVVGLNLRDLGSALALSAHFPRTQDLPTMREASNQKPEPGLLQRWVLSPHPPLPLYPASNFGWGALSTWTHPSLHSLPHWMKIRAGKPRSSESRSILGLLDRDGHLCSLPKKIVGFSKSHSLNLHLPNQEPILSHRVNQAGNTQRAGCMSRGHSATGQPT